MVSCLTHASHQWVHHGPNCFPHGSLHAQDELNFKKHCAASGSHNSAAQIQSAWHGSKIVQKIVPAVFISKEGWWKLRFTSLLELFKFKSIPCARIFPARHPEIKGFCRPLPSCWNRQGSEEPCPGFRTYLAHRASSSKTSLLPWVLLLGTRRLQFLGIARLCFWVQESTLFWRTLSSIWMLPGTRTLQGGGEYFSVPGTDRVLENPSSIWGI